MTNTLTALVHREWLQHRFSWALMALVPTALALLLLSFGTLHVPAEEHGEHLPLAMALSALGAGMGLYLAMLWVVALISVAGFARRDHGDRSVEFWLSLPTGHAASLGVPLAVHLLLAPVVAIGVGLVGGMLCSMVLIGRLEGFGTWLALPWDTLMAGAAAIAARLAAGTVMAALWLSPLLLAVVLLTAWFGRSGLVLFALALGLGPVVLSRGFGIDGPAEVLAEILDQAGRAVAAPDAGGRFHVETPNDIADAVALIPGWAAADAVQALGRMVSPVFVGGLLVAGLSFALLVRWRRLGAQAGR